jgi:hypothetical protein
MGRTLNKRLPEQETEVQTATYLINVTHSGIPEECSMNCTELLPTQERTEFRHLPNRAIKLVTRWSVAQSV